MSKTVDVNGKKYAVEIRGGVRFIDGKTVEEFCATLDKDTLLRASRIGKMAIEDEIKGIKPPKGKYQYYINEPLK